MISNMAMNTQNIEADARASLFVGQVGDGDPLGTARATLVGDVLPVPKDEVSEARQRYLSRYENSRSWVDFKDFPKGTRINFLREVQNSDEARKVLVEMVRAADPKA